MSREILQCSALQILAAAIARTYRLSQTNSLLWRNGLECARNSHFHQILTLSYLLCLGAMTSPKLGLLEKLLYFLYWKYTFSTAFLRRCPKSGIYMWGFYVYHHGWKFFYRKWTAHTQKVNEWARRGWSWKTTFAHRCPDNFSNHYSKPTPPYLLTTPTLWRCPKQDLGSWFCKSYLNPKTTECWST